MLRLPGSVRVFLCLTAVDMRRSFDGLAAMAEHVVGQDPLSGHLFVFRNRRGDRVKILVWDQSGFWVLYKRLEHGTFAWPADEAPGAVTIASRDLLVLLAGVDLTHTRRRRWYDRVPTA